MDVIKNHHFVSQFYLKAWSKCGKKVFTTINNSNVRSMAVEKVASTNYFYEIRTINTETKEILLKELKKQNLPLMGNLLCQIINGISTINLFKSVFGQKIITKEEKLLQCNTIEGVYGVVEDLAAPIIKKIIDDNTNDFDINDYQNVLRYAVYQLTRTAKVKNLTKDKVKPILENKNIDYDSYHILMSIILSEQMLLSFIEKLFKIIVLDNKTSVNFITNDNPIFNLHTIESKKVKLYLPISAKKALFFEELKIDEKSATILKNNILDNKQYDKYFLDSILVTKEQVLNLNQKIKENSDMFVFSLEENDITAT